MMVFTNVSTIPKLFVIFFEVRVQCYQVMVL